MFIIPHRIDDNETDVHSDSLDMDEDDDDDDSGNATKDPTDLTTSYSSYGGSACTDECCNNLNVPYHSVDIRSSKRRQGKQSRTFQKAWFSDHKWLSYCKTRNVVFCFYCSVVVN